MVRSVTLLLNGAFFVAITHAELQLTPRVSEYKGDGATFKRFEFFDNGKTVTYQSPHGWEYSGSPAQLTLRPPGKSQAEATIRRVSLSEPGSFDEESLEKLVSDTVAQVPKGSEDVCVVSQEKNLLMIQGKETFLITLNYSLYGEKYARSILLLNREKEQIRSQLTCREADFNDLQREFLRSLNTWQNL